MTKWFWMLTVTVAALAAVGCGSKEENFTVDENDPSSVANASETPPVPMRSDGTPLDTSGNPPMPEKD